MHAHLSGRAMFTTLLGAQAGGATMK